MLGQQQIRPLGNGKFQTPVGVFNTYAEAMASLAKPMSPALGQPSYGDKLGNIAQDSKFGYSPTSEDMMNAKMNSSQGFIPQAPAKLMNSPQSPATTQQDMVTQSEPSFMDRLTSAEGLGGIGSMMLAMSNDPSLQKLGMSGMTQFGKDAKAKKMQNRTVKALRDAKRDDLADAVESGLIGATDAAKILFSKPDAYKAASPVGKLAADLKAGVITQDEYKKGLEDLAKSGVNVKVGGSYDLGAIPKGYYVEYDKDGRPIGMKPIQGSPDQLSKDKAVEQGSRSGEIVLDDIGRLKDLIQNQDIFDPVTGIAGKIASFIPSSGRVDAEGLATTIRGNIGFDRLQQMRDASPTGGALGQVSVQELNTLQSVLGNLSFSQSEETLLYNLERLGEVYSGIMKKFAAYPNAEEFGISSAGVSLEEDPLKLF